MQDPEPLCPSQKGAVNLLVGRPDPGLLRTEPSPGHGPGAHPLLWAEGLPARPVGLIQWLDAHLYLHLMCLLSSTVPVLSLWDTFFLGTACLGGFWENYLRQRMSWIWNFGGCVTHPLHPPGSLGRYSPHSQQSRLGGTLRS